MKRKTPRLFRPSSYKLLALLILVALAVTAIYIIGNNKDNESTPESSIQSTEVEALNLSFADYSGQSKKLSEFLNDGPLVINSWAVWCPFCVKELGDFDDAQAQFKGRVTIIAINRAEPLAVAKDFTDQLGISQSLVLLRDPEDKFYKAIGGFSMPETIFISRDGTIVEHKRGPLTKEEIIQKITLLVEE